MCFTSQVRHVFYENDCWRSLPEFDGTSNCNGDQRQQRSYMESMEVLNRLPSCIRADMCHIPIWMPSAVHNWLVLWNMNFIFHHIWDVILPIFPNSIIFQDGFLTTNQNSRFGFVWKCFFPKQQWSWWTWLNNHSDGPIGTRLRWLHHEDGVGCIKHVDSTSKIWD